MKNICLQELIASNGPQETQKNSCLICLSLLCNPVQCIICKTKYCKKCADRWNQLYNRCPIRCSSVWNYQPIQPINIQLRCPFNNECEYSKVETIHQHIQSCRFSNIIRKSNQEKKIENLCAKQHKLQFLISPQLILNSICAQCDKKQICRQICTECYSNNEPSIYCCKCRPVQFSTNMCCFGHRFKLTKENAERTGCDACGNIVAKKNKKYYHDPVCDLAICFECMKAKQQLEKRKKDQFQCQPMIIQ